MRTRISQLIADDFYAGSLSKRRLSLLYEFDCFRRISRSIELYGNYLDSLSAQTGLVVADRPM